MAGRVYTKITICKAFSVIHISLQFEIANSKQNDH